MDSNRDFDEWFSSFRNTIYGCSYYVDFPKVFKNVDAIKIELNLMNSLIGSVRIKEDFIALAKRYPNVLETIPILIAVREKEIEIMDNKNQNFCYNFHNKKLSAEQCSIFMEETGLFDLISKHIISNLVDYVTGVETGLDSNARKNRGGHAMESLVERYLKKSNCNYFKEMWTSEINKKWGVDLSKLSATADKAEKRFDFVVEHGGTIYGIEVNFYAGGGSKLNETARSYKMLALESKGMKQFNFVWITDGAGWKTAHNNLRETFNAMEHLYCISDLEKGTFERLFSKK